MLIVGCISQVDLRTLERAKVYTRASTKVAEAVVDDQASTISTASLKTFLSLHVRPINPVVFRGSLIQMNVHYSSSGRLPA